MRKIVQDDLMYNNLVINQYEDGYRFNSDSVLLANLAKCKKGAVCADLGAGSGVISILFTAKNDIERTYAIEIQQCYFDLLKQNIECNNLNNKIIPVFGDMKDAYKTLNGVCDVVLSNPPYSKISKGLVGDNEEIAIARQEIKITLAEVVESASKLLKYGGSFFVIYKAERLISLINAMEKFGLMPKKIISVSPKKNIPCDTVIVEGKKGGKPEGLKLENIVVYNDDNTMTDEVKKLYDLI